MQLRSVPNALDQFIQTNRATAPLTSWGVGGVAAVFAVPGNENELAALLRWFYDENLSFYVLGGGTNVLIADGRIDLPMISMSEMRGREINRNGKRVLITCDAGTPLRELFSLALRMGWSGLEFAAGIPGTVGGALMGNAGTAAGAIGQAVESMRTVERDGSVREWSNADLRWEYRRCGLPDEAPRVISKVVLGLEEDERNAVRERAKMAASGRKSQPFGVRTAGCVFKNPPGDSAGRLLDLSGCKVFSVGTACVSPKHANFIENRGNCSARDIMALAMLCRRRVEEHFGVLLHFEIKKIGFSEGVGNA